MAIAIKAIIHNLTQTRYEGEALTEFLMDYAKNNRDQFSMVYSNDIIEGVDGISLDDKGETQEKYTLTALKNMNKDSIVEILAKRSVQVEGSVNKDDLIDMVLDTQK